MAVISITITASNNQLIAGIPQNISVLVSIPSTVFYTLDGSDPSDMSSVYTSPISLPTDEQTVILKLFATNGTDTSPILTETYSTSIAQNSRVPRTEILNLDSASKFPLFPFGTDSHSSPFDYVNTKNIAGITVTDVSKPIIPYGYNADGYTVGANKPLTDYLNVYSETDSHGRFYPGVGNLPGQVTVIGRRSPLQFEGESSSRSDRLYNSKAMVIYQDAATEDPSNPPQINPQFFSFAKKETYDDGALLHHGGVSTPTPRGNYINSHYNSRTNTVTNYYRDADTNRWIISSYPFEDKQAHALDGISTMVYPRGSGIGFVFSWHIFRSKSMI